MNKHTAVVSCGAGFLCSHLCDPLLSGDFKFIFVDNLLICNMENIFHHFGNEDFKPDFALVVGNQ